MPSTLVHMALAALLATALLEDAFGLRALLVVVGVTAMADLDAFASLVMAGAHRSLLHTLLIPGGLGALVWYDGAVRERSWLREQCGHNAPRIAGVSLFAFALSAIGLDFVTNGANVLYPVHDQFYVLDGELLFSTKEGLVQTFVDRSPGTVPAPEAIGNSSEVHLSTGVDPREGPEPATVERVFPVVRSGWEALVLGLGVFVPAFRLREGGQN